MVKSGIIDPAKVTRSALQNAASVAALLLTTECAIIDLPERSLAERGSPSGALAQAPPIGGGGMGGMGGIIVTRDIAPALAGIK